MVDIRLSGNNKKVTILLLWCTCCIDGSNYDGLNDRKQRYMYITGEEGSYVWKTDNLLVYVTESINFESKLRKRILSLKRTK